MVHTVWRISDPARVEAIAAAISAEPIVIADGHHRYETSLAYRDERRADSPDGTAGGAEAVMCFVVELVDDELSVGPIHRLLSGLPDDLDLVAPSSRSSPSSPSRSPAPARSDACRPKAPSGS